MARHHLQHLLKLFQARHRAVRDVPSALVHRPWLGGRRRRSRWRWGTSLMTLKFWVLVLVGLEDEICFNFSGELDGDGTFWRFQKVGFQTSCFMTGLWWHMRPRLMVHDSWFSCKEVWSIYTNNHTNTSKARRWYKIPARVTPMDPIFTWKDHPQVVGTTRPYHCLLSCEMALIPLMAGNPTHPKLRKMCQTS